MSLIPASIVPGNRADHAVVLRLAGPLILTNVSVAFLGLVDTAVVGHLSHPYYIGAVAVGALLFDFLYWSLGFLRMGTTGIVAQIHGRKNPDRLRATLTQSLLLALALAALVLIMQTPFLAIALSFIDGSEEVKSFASEYYRIRIWSVPAVLAIYGIIGWCIGVQNVRAPLVIAVVSNLVNIVLDLLLVIVFDMGVAGVALASVVSEYTALAVGGGMVVFELRRHGGRWRSEHVLDIGSLRRMLTVNRDIFIRTICLLFAFAFFTRQGALQGDVVLAANAVLMNFQILMALGLDGFANAAEALVGKAIGAQNRVDFTRAVRIAMAWSIFVAIVFSFVFAAGGEPIIRVITDIPEVRSMAYRYLPWLTLLPLVSVWCFMFDGIFVGGTRAVEMRNSMLFSTFLVFLPAWYFLQPLGNDGLWLAFVLFMVARGISMWLLYLRIERSVGFVRHSR